ncbi:MAG: hotdog fold thioesterase [Actinomycetales bacterium]|nr:hotdog fold thioesterase [Actinomycetales bacterium]
MDDDIASLIASRGPGALAERMGIELTEVSLEQVVARMPVEGNTQPYGLLHGGASAVIAETVGSLHAALHAGAQRQAVGLDINCTHHRSATSGSVTATSTPLSLGNTIASLAISVVDDEGRLVCTSRLTCLIRDKRG